MAEKDLRKLIQDQDKDTVVQNSVKNTLNKKLKEMHPTERLAIAGQAVDEEIAIARDTGQIDDQTALATREAAQNPKKYDKEIKKGGVKGKFLEALTYFAPQAIGMAIGGAVGGLDGAVQGGNNAHTLAQGFRDESRAQEKHDADMGQQDITNELKRRDQELRGRKLDSGDRSANKFKAKDFLYRKSDGALLSFKESDGKVYDSAGNVVEAGEYVNTSVNRDINQKARVDQGAVRVDIAKTNAALRDKGLNNRIEEQGEADRLKLFDAFEKDPEVKNIKEAVAKIDPALKALESGSTMAPGMAQSALARLSGEVGALTETDLSRFGGKQSFLAKIKRFKEKQTSGTAMTKDDKLQFKYMLKILKTSKSNRLKDIKKVKKRGFTAASGDVSSEQADAILDIKPEVSLEQKRNRLQELRAKRAAAKGSR